MSAHEQVSSAMVSSPSENLSVDSVAFKELYDGIRDPYNRSRLLRRIATQHAINLFEEIFELTKNSEHPVTIETFARGLAENERKLGDTPPEAFAHQVGPLAIEAYIHLTERLEAWDTSGEASGVEQYMAAFNQIQADPHVRGFING